MTHQPKKRVSLYSLTTSHLRRTKRRIALERLNARKERGISNFGRAEWLREKGIVARLALTEMADTQKVGTMGVLLTMWQIYKSGRWRKEHPENFQETETFQEYLDIPDANGERLGDHLDDDYRTAFIYAVERILAYVYGTPVYLDTGERITPEMLIERAGVGKLKTFSYRISVEENIERKHRMIADLISKSFDHWREDWNKETTQTSQTIVLPDYLVTYVAHDRVRVEWNAELTLQQFHAFESAFGAFARARLA